MRSNIILTILMLFGLNALAQIDSITYGISALSSGTGIYLSKINPQSGIVTNISDSLLDYSIGSNGKSIDPIHDIFFYCTDSILLKINLFSGDLINAIPIVQYQNTVFQGLVYNCFDTTIYGLAWDVNGQAIWLANLDKHTGEVEQISESPITQSYRSLTSMSINPFSNVLYFETIDNTLVGADLVTGEIVTEVTIGLPNGQFFGPLIFNCHDSILYGLTGNMSQGRKLSTINPNTGEVTILSQGIVIYSIQNDPASIDPFQKLYYIIGADTSFKGVDLETGALVVDSYINSVLGTKFSSFFFNHPCFINEPVNTYSYLNSTFKIYPNPVNESITIVTNSKIKSIQLFDIYGRMLFSEYYNYSLTSISLDVSFLTDGLYFVNINTSIRHFLGKIIVQQNTFY